MTEQPASLPRIRWAGIIGALAGLAWSVSGLVSILSFFGFWMSGALLLVITAPLALWYTTSRQHAAWHSVALAAAFVVGLVPGAWKEAWELEAFWGELLFPLVIGVLLALTLAPIYVGIARRLVLRGHHPSAI